MISIWISANNAIKIHSIKTNYFFFFGDKKNQKKNYNKSKSKIVFAGLNYF